MINSKLTTLIVDDEFELRKSIASILVKTMPDIAFDITEASTGVEALQRVKENNFDLVLMDVKMPEMGGIEALTAIKDHDPRTFVVLMTAHSNLHDAVLAIKEGAYDYFEKPVDPETLSKIVRKSIEARDMVSRLALSNPIFDDDIDTEFVGNSLKMKEVFNLIYRLCRVETTVLIRGENGTGKELVARAIHFNSARKNGNFVAVNCGAIPESLMESEFFGHEKGAFTGAIERKIGKFQAANNGTLFLDEIGELRPEMQVKMLRVLQERSFVPVGSHREVKTNTRIIAATNRNLEKMMEEGTFREDLFYRLNVMPIFLPPLRDRVEDIEALASHFIKKFAKQQGSGIVGMAGETSQILKKYRWPGNIRELENVIERAFIVENTQQILPTSLPHQMLQQTAKEISARTELGDIPLKSGPLDYDIFREEMEKEFIVSALKANKGRINQTVAHANIPKNTLLRKIRKYNINVKDYMED